MKKIVSLLLSVVILMGIAAGCASQAPQTPQVTTPGSMDEPVKNLANQTVKPGDLLGGNPTGEYNPGVVLIKSENAPDMTVLAQYGIVSAQPLYDGSCWYTARLRDGEKTVETVNALRQLDCFDGVDYDYVMGIDDSEVTDVTTNPDFEKSKHFGPHGILQGWKHMNDHGRHPGGSADVIVAVIDTGVDYNHLDLRNNIWVNSGEIPGNGIDDDGNGYVDDVNGWNCVGNNNDPMDDNGHGTHVAGIIAAENNSIGGVGAAYNCKIMPIKAGNSSGYFNNSDIAEAIQYAYMNGASVINMSFGGSNISIAVEDALVNAYNSCVQVAAAGNDSLCNQPGCSAHTDALASYPAALPYVIGVMSTDANGNQSGFSNYDHYPYNGIEYEVYAVGETIPSTWPGNKYATLQGTSMAAPSVSGIAALLRSYYTDRELYSTKFIQSQIVNTGTLKPDGVHALANIYEALTQLPKPNVNLYDYWIDDSAAIADGNNGNGVIDAGETVRLYFSLHNRGGVASNVKVTADVIRNDNTATVDPYFTFVNSEIQLSDIGTYSVRESGDQYFEIIVSPDCPNDYLTTFNIRYTYENGLDSEDTTVYTDDGKQTATFNISRGFHLPGIISEDTVFTADKLYIVADDVVIPAGVSVTFEPGCEIQFYADKEYYNSPKISVYGTLNINGTKEAMVKILPTDKYDYFECLIMAYHGIINLKHVDAINLRVCTDNSYGDDGGVNIDALILKLKGNQNGDVYCFTKGSSGSAYHNLSVHSLTNSYIEPLPWCGIYATTMSGNTIVVRNTSLTSSSDSKGSSRFVDNTVYSIRDSRSSNSGSYLSYFSEISNNQFIAVNETKESIMEFHFITSDHTGNPVYSNVFNNTFSPAHQQYAAQIIESYIGSDGNPIVDVYGSCSDISVLYPHVVSMELFNKDGEKVTTIGKEEITVRVTFNRPMDQSQDTFVTFGTVEPYADYRIDGGYISDTVWEGTYTLKAQIENGQNFLKVHNACAAEDPTMEVHGEFMLHEFTIDTTAALSMSLFAEPREDGINLTWLQDDYDTLMGYNIYRSEEKDGNFVKINPAILLATDEAFLDTNAEPGKTYWYTFTVVLSDFTESAPAGKVMATAVDTMAPNIYHTPVNQGYMNNNLVISCTASDNIAIESVTLCYRTVGDEAWKSLAMSKVNDKYSATIFGSDLSMAGLEYYIVATDGRNIITKGSSETPYTVVIKDASAISRLGDVDGDNTITTKDALMIMQAINGDLLLSDDQFKRADLNKDGVLSSVEALRILQYINGKINTLEM